MKKMILAVALLLTGIVSAQADGREKPITIELTFDDKRFALKEYDD